MDDTLSVTTTLTNLGRNAFSTVWYSHNFFTCDDVAVGPDYLLDLNLNGDQDPLYEEPGTWSWSTPLDNYARVQRNSGHITVQMLRAVEPGIRVKSEFTRDDTTNGGFSLHACGSKITSAIPQTEDPTSGISMYAYNLYLERGTMSPEPQILMHLDPGQSATWSQKLTIGDESMPDEAWQYQANLRAASLAGSVASTTDLMERHPILIPVVALTMLALTLQSVVRLQRRRQMQHRYSRIGDVPDTIQTDEQ